MTPRASPASAASSPPRAVRENEWARAVSELDRAGEVCLACHVRPDGDALGSMLAVAHALAGRGRGRAGGG